MKRWLFNDRSFFVIIVVEIMKFEYKEGWFLMNNISITKQFEWVDFYKEFADILRSYKNKRPVLCLGIESVFNSFEKCF